MMYWNGSGMNGWGYALMTLSTVVFWVLLITGMVLLVRYLTRTAQGPGGSAVPAADEVLAQRYARGEIDAEEYRTRLSTLHGTHMSGNTS
ncbi:SHOCT domain-containing protein [Sphaerisporangium dianthi]|uniref:SHOCT domain-containing protein n=1 Tax=Sphaerisporangium dianthi TaxID=1436120 RepID=A0ABV9CV82_9ACTN